uniref:Reverse transcriptase domain-containing protein n=1 Tax=Tanacetum cinerariifolium TaxID=118510 RepID=A0A699GJR1_TANCI|nr:hypothetical protein [Tanacetum cinerariifolium]
MAKLSSSSENEVYDDSYCSKSCRKNTKNLNTKISKLNEELSDCENNLYHYKIGLSQVEARLVEFKTQEIKFCKKIRGLERDVEFPPPAQVYSPPKKDLSWTGLPEFVDDTITDYSRPPPSIDTSKSNTSDLQNSNFSISELGESSGSITSKPMIKQVNTARPKAVINVVRTNRVNDVIASACWVWRPIKPNSASITLKRYDYVDVRGRSRLHNDVQNIHEELAVYINTLSWDRHTIYYNDDDDEDCTITITPILSTKDPDNSLSMGAEHLDTIPEMESDEFIKSSVENLVLNPSESKGEHDDDQSFYDEDIPKKIYSNPLFDEEIISMKIDPHHFNVESDLIESLLNHDSSLISSSSKIDSLLDEFADEFTLIKSIPPAIDKTDCDPEEETPLIKKLLYDNSSPRLLEEFIFENSDAAIESFSPFPIHVEDSDSYIEEIDLSFTLDDSMPPGIEGDEYESKKDILILEELLSNNSLSLPENESFYFDIPSSSHPPAKPPDGNSGILNIKVMGDISKHKVPMPRLMLIQPTLVPNQEKSLNFLSHQGHEASQPSIECR